MGIVKAIKSAIEDSFADQWLEVIEANDMGDQTVFTNGVKIRKGSNTKGTVDTVSNGSVIHVYPNQFMMLVDGGRVVDYTAEEGYYTVNDSSLPSLFNGEFGDTLKETFNRIRYGGKTPGKQKVYFINLQEIKGIKFGTRTPINYFDSFYHAELFLRAHGTYSIKITDPLVFYEEVIPKNQEQVEIQSVNEQYFSEFLEALQSSINQMSADGIRISYVASKGRELGKYMSDVLDEDWRQKRGMEIASVGVASISYDEESTRLIHLRNEGAMLSDPSVREGYVQGAVARGMEAAGSNASGSMAGFMGMGVGIHAGGGFMGAASNTNFQQMQMNQAAADRRMGGKEPGEEKKASWSCSCGTENTGKFCSECGKPRPAEEKSTWVCSCGMENTGKFCSECGKPRPAEEKSTWVCSCGVENTGKFCSECGKPRS